jgi:hypothetical protein
MQQQRLIAGDSLVFATSVPDYLPSAGYTLTYRLVRRDAAGAAITFAAGVSGDLYSVSVTPATTAGWTAGRYTWASYVTKAGERYTVGQGELVIEADPALITAPYDNRSHARKVLDAIEAVLEGRASTDQQQVSVAGRTLTRMPITELLLLRDRYRAEAASEAASEQIRTTGINPRFIGVRFNRA